LDQGLTSKVKIRFLEELRHHSSGWLEKATADFSKKSFEAELADLRGDPVYRDFGFASPEYALIRLMGRSSISIGRRLGEIYDKIPRFLAQARFDLSPDSVAPKLDGLILDICIPMKELSEKDRGHVQRVAKEHLNAASVGGGIAIEMVKQHFFCKFVRSPAAFLWERSLA
jgi:hypothetical protein